ncbi:MAG: pyruvate, phosphate dikinase [Spirochaetaceae bacterium]|jgi:pyruvate,orthophosphate dikinase|nr:pyruvate, phosphate dikinase [Spirochaetaceae bacterium]
MDRRIHFFSGKTGGPQKAAPELLGIRGRQAVEFAELGFPILPGFILDASLASRLESADIRRDLDALPDRCGAVLGKRYGDRENPLLLKIVVSSNLAVSTYPVLHNFGLVKGVVPGFARWVGDAFAARETLFLLRGMLLVEKRIRELEGTAREGDELDRRLRALQEEFRSGPLSAAEAYMDRYAPLLPGGFFEDPREQIFLALRELSRLLSIDDQNDNDTALLIQPMVFGNYGRDSCSGFFFSRNVLTGERRLQGEWYRGQFDASGGEGQDLGTLESRYLKELEKIGRTLEDRFKEIRQIRFTIEKGKLYFLEQRPADRKSTRADIRLLLDLAKRKVVDAAFVVKAIDPPRLGEIIHRVIDPAGVKALKKRAGGIAGSPGAAIGRVCFSTRNLLEARKLALQQGEDTRFILALPSSFAEDVKAIELASGVLTAEGGYSAHASVVARQYGKASLVAPGLTFKGKKAVLGDLGFSEGDYITLDVPYHGEPAVYLGKAGLIEGDGADSGLPEFIALAKGFLKGFHVRANAESPEDAEKALAFGAEGIGLCRTEHMFLKADRINLFRDLLLSDSGADRSRALKAIRSIQEEDFYGILKVMAGKEVTIRLLDAPLHEFMPHNNDELAAYIAHIEKTRKKTLSKAELLARIEALDEFNPMLGHRGCRIAVSYPEIYAAQVRAIFDAVYRLREEKIPVRPEIMVPIIMDAAELKLVAYGKKIEGAEYTGIAEVEEAVREERKAKRAAYKIGAMIELPAAALGAGEIAKYAGFFSFGTNDLTQTALGISRDDFAGFMSDYTRFDLVTADPFTVLDRRVKELITLAVARGRLTRPDLVCGLCGEHGANPANVRFCMEAGLDYVSCSSYAVPIALLAAAQAELEKAR